VAEPIYFDEPRIAKRLFASTMFAWLWLMLRLSWLGVVRVRVGQDLIMAWRVAGWCGLDCIVLPVLGTPWQPGTLFSRKQPART
jgi:hypothetical protein